MPWNSLIELPIATLTQEKIRPEVFWETFKFIAQTNRHCRSIAIIPTPFSSLTPRR